MKEFILCSDCFFDQGLKLDSFYLGVDDNNICPNCRSRKGKKLDKKTLLQLVDRFFVRGTIIKPEYGAYPIIQFNEYQNTSIKVSNGLKKDIELIEKILKIGFFYYGPRLWMTGEIEPLKLLQNNLEREGIIKRIIKEYPDKLIKAGEIFYRLRKKPNQPSKFHEYDSPPDKSCGNGRLDSKVLPILYGSKDLQVCIHECRVTIEDELYIATLSPTRNLKLLDLTELLNEESTEFESLDMAIHMLFLAGKHSYEISRDIALHVFSAGYDGIIYPSYFSLVRTGSRLIETVYGISIRKLPDVKNYAKSQTIQNIALFGRPIKNGDVSVKCINRLVLNTVNYDVNFGPVEY
ncbi:RES family NAD+ phosphorylase [Clostridium oceanicum]|uniref:RES family NAD+ phosphorylase n=1 Tax=Clostridium oceanicum TaxID=1543 RepID=A0ABN1J904_9CLOT